MTRTAFKRQECSITLGDYCQTNARTANVMLQIEQDEQKGFLVYNNLVHLVDTLKKRYIEIL